MEEFGAIKYGAQGWLARLAGAPSSEAKVLRLFISGDRSQVCSQFLPTNVSTKKFGKQRVSWVANGQPGREPGPSGPCTFDMQHLNC